MVAPYDAVINAADGIMASGQDDNPAYRNYDGREAWSRFFIIVLFLLSCRRGHCGGRGPPAGFDQLLMKLPKTRDMMADSFTTMLRDGPEVSFSGSPTVSPVTAFL